MSAPTADDLRRSGWREHALAGHIGHVGPLWSKREDDAWAYGILVDERHLNPAGTAHGGLLVTLLDHAFSAIAWAAADRRPCLTVALDAQFVGSAGLGSFLEVRGRVIHRSRSMIFLQGTMTAGDRVVLAGSTVLKIVDRDGAADQR